jgi:chemotaxis protein MotB
MSGLMRERRKGNVSRDRWLVSYADFITLLFGFFVVLYAFAKADQKKQSQVTASIDAAFHSLGIFPDQQRQRNQRRRQTGHTYEHRDG